VKFDVYELIADTLDIKRTRLTIEHASIVIDDLVMRISLSLIFSQGHREEIKYQYTRSRDAISNSRRINRGGAIRVPDRWNLRTLTVHSAALDGALLAGEPLVHDNENSCQPAVREINRRVAI
jgi:hypothetical protein